MCTIEYFVMESQTKLNKQPYPPQKKNMLCLVDYSFCLTTKDSTQEEVAFIYPSFVDMIFAV